MQINNLVEFTAQKFESVFGFENVDFALVRQKSVQISVVCDGCQHGCLWSFLTDDSSVSNDGKSPPAVSSVEGAGGVVDSSDIGSEGLGLGGGPVLSLVRLGH